mgnify:CR=1 FL=1
MGGRVGFIVNKGADLDAAAEGIVTSAFGFSGQKCSACSRAIIHQDVYDSLVDKVVKRAEAAVSVGPGVDGEASMGAVVDKKQYDQILKYIEIGKGESRLVLGGEPAAEEGHYVEPTILPDVPGDARMACGEISGQVRGVGKRRG